MKEDDLLLASLEDKYIKCEKQYVTVHTAFLDMREKSLAEEFCKRMKICNINAMIGEERIGYDFRGGYEDAERTILVFTPGYMMIDMDDLLTVVSVSVKPGSRMLTHRDYLGSLMGLGLKREVIGDILVRKQGADIIVMKDMEDFISLNYEKVGRADLEIEMKRASEIIVPKASVETVQDTVASLRLDNIVASLFYLSRSKAVTAIKSGMVFVNNMAETKIDLHVCPMDKIVLRGKGKRVLVSEDGTSKKGRRYITFKKYL